MYISELFNKVKGDSIVTLILHQEPNMPNTLRYYMIATGTGYSALTTDTCTGEITDSLKIFDIELSTITLLINQGLNLTISIEDGQIIFTDKVKSIKITPISTERANQSAIDVLKHFQAFQQTPSKNPVSLTPFKSITEMAAHRHRFLSLCGEYAILELDTCHIIQKAPCINRGLPSPMLNLLMKAGKGENFYIYNDSLTYYYENDFITLTPYMPSAKVDSTIITKGQVLEHYQVNLSTVRRLTPKLRTKFDKVQFDMSDGTCTFTSSRNERVQVTIEVKNASSIAINKAKKDPSQLSNITASNFIIPWDAVSVLSYFNDLTDIYIKSKKIIFHCNKLYLIFGRSESNAN